MRKVCCKEDRALALIVISIEPSLLYLIRDPGNWLAIFRKKTWANKLQLRCEVVLATFERGSVRTGSHKSMREIFE